MSKSKPYINPVYLPKRSTDFRVIEQANRLMWFFRSYHGPAPAPGSLVMRRGLPDLYLLREYHSDFNSVTLVKMDRNPEDE